MRYFDIITASSLIGASVLMLSGCATTQSFSPQQCQTANWHDLGYNDGVAGRSGNYFGQYLQNCGGVTGGQPNRIVWEQGRLEGLKEFCTELNAYKLGREGFAWQPVCPTDNIEKLEEAYSEGRYYYLRQRDMEYLASPWGYGPYGYGPYRWRHPFWHPYW